MRNVLVTSRLILKFAHEENFINFQKFEIRNAQHLAPWETINPRLTDKDYQRRLKNWAQEDTDGHAVRFFLYLRNDLDNQIIGMCNFTNIIRGPFQACYLGYKIDSLYQGKGLMFEALQASIRFMFEEKNLHRIMANYMPRNERSGKLLERLGFEIEGKAKKYLLINNVWEDHIMTASINAKWQNKQI